MSENVKKVFKYSLIIVTIIGIFFFFMLCINDRRSNSYKEQYFSDKESYTRIAEILIQYYEGNKLQDEVSIWCSENDATVFYGDSLDVYDDPIEIKKSFEKSELDEIYNFMDDSRYEYVSINGRFVEFGNSTGSIFMYLCLTDEKPEKISQNHRMFDFGEGWYCSICVAR